LKRRADQYLQSGNNRESDAINSMAELYLEGLITVKWENGEPVFKYHLDDYIK